MPPCRAPRTWRMYRREEPPLAPTTAAPAILAANPVPERSNGTTNLGFLTVLQEANGYVGGYLVTNTWGRPLEFRLSSAVQPNRVQQILYAATLQPYICADLIGKTLVDKAGVAVQLVVTDREAVLDLRLKTDALVLWLAAGEDARTQALARDGATVESVANGRGTLYCHPRFRADVTAARELLLRLDSTFDLAEPFSRIREAIAESRKLGVAGR
jgi:hypothetical protein